MVSESEATETAMWRCSARELAVGITLVELNAVRGSASVFRAERMRSKWRGANCKFVRKSSASSARRILRALDETPPEGYARWNGRLLARRLKDVSQAQVWRVLRQHSISLERRRSWCISTDPYFAQKAADIVGLYLQPPQNAVVLCIDEKPHIQALERAQGWLKLPNGKALTGFNHEYKRHGTTTLPATTRAAAESTFWTS